MLSIHEDSSLHLLSVDLASRFLIFSLINDLMEETDFFLHVNENLKSSKEFQSRLERGEVSRRFGSDERILIRVKEL